MIRINCTKCKAQLSIDDAFAGGVCRCQYCGTIQTVPNRLKNADAASGSGIAATAGNAAKALGASGSITPNRPRRDKNASGGLDELADAIATSSGLSNHALSTGQRRLTEPPSADEPARSAGANRTTQLLILCGIAIVLLLGVLIGVLIRNSGTPPTNTAAAPTGGGDAPSSPLLFGTPLKESTIVFVLERGDSTTFEYAKLATAKAIRALRPDQKFQVILGKVEGEKEPRQIPKALSGPTPDALSTLSGAFEDVTAGRQSDLKSALAKAFTSKPMAVVLETAKGGDELAKLVLDARKDGAAHVYCFSLNAPALAKPMTDIATKTGGGYRDVPMAELQSAR